MFIRCCLDDVLWLLHLSTDVDFRQPCEISLAEKGLKHIDNTFEVDNPGSSILIFFVLIY